MAPPAARFLAERIAQQGIRIARRRTSRAVQKKVRELARGVAHKLDRQIQEGNDIPAMMILIFLAVLKDGLLDWGLNLIGVGLIPVLGQIPGWFVSAILYYFMLGKGYFMRQRAKMNMRAWLYILGFILDGLPAVEELPITTITVIHTIRLLRKRAHKAKEDLRKLEKATEQEVKEIQKELEGN